MPDKWDITVPLVSRTRGRTSPSIDALFEFVRSSDGIRLIQQFFVANVTTGVIEGEHLLAEHCHAMLALCAGLNEEDASYLGDVLYELLSEAVLQFLENLAASDEDLLLELQSEARNRLTYHLLASIDNSARFLRYQSPEQLHEYYLFEKSVRQQVAHRYGFIEPPDLYQQARVEIDKLYVAPYFSQTSGGLTWTSSEPGSPTYEEEGIGTSASLNELKNSMFRCVVLGHPGAGKSTLVKKLAHDSSTSDESPVGLNALPLVVVLRHYASRFADDGQSLPDFIAERCRADLQLEVPRRGIEYLLEASRAFMLFDGLDELTDVSLRREVVAAVESFSVRFPDIPIIVTSRIVGYAQAPLDPNIFSTLELREFDFPQVSEYAEKWFSLRGSDPNVDVGSRVEAFLDESLQVGSLAQNPLMLALLCNIYRRENHIPRNRPAVYRACTDMLLHRWDLSRGISVRIPHEQFVRSTLAYVAFWILSNRDLQEAVVERNLVSTAADYLQLRRFDERADAVDAAREFVDYCAGRAWVFTDVGLTDDGERLFRFTHRTFLEYFAAFHLVYTHASPVNLWKALSPRVMSAEWDVVAQLAFAMVERENAVDDMIAELIHDARHADVDQRTALLDFANRLMHFMFPRPSTIRQLIDAVWECQLERCAPLMSATTAFLDVDVLVGLMGVEHENLDVVSEALEDNYWNTFDAEVGDVVRAVAACTALNLGEVVELSDVRSDIVDDRTDWWNRLASDMSQGVDEDEPLARDSATLCIALIRQRIMSPSEGVKRHGMNLLFLPSTDLKARGSHYRSESLAAMFVLDAFIGGDSSQSSDPLESVAMAFIESTVPVNASFDSGEGRTRYQPLAPSLFISMPRMLDGMERYGYLLLMMAAFEGSLIDQRYLDDFIAPLGPLASIVRSRGHDAARDVASQISNQVIADVVRSWLEGDPLVGGRRR